jgi:hypothetical protein
MLAYLLYRVPTISRVRPGIETRDGIGQLELETKSMMKMRTSQLRREPSHRREKQVARMKILIVVSLVV